MSVIFLILATVLLFTGGIWLLVVAFRESVLWGLGSLLVPFVSLVFVILHWQDAKKPFLIQMAGIGFLILGALLSDGGTHTPAIGTNPL